MEEKQLSFDEQVDQNIKNWHAEQDALKQAEEVKKEPTEKKVGEEKPPLPQEAVEEVTEDKVEEATEEVVEKEQVSTDAKQEFIATLKVGDKEIQVTEEQLIGYAQKGYVSGDKFQQAALMKRDAERKIEAAQVIYNAIAQPTAQNKQEKTQGRLKALKQIISPEELRDLFEEGLTPFVKEEMELANLSEGEKRERLAQQRANDLEAQVKQKEQSIQKKQWEEQVQLEEKSLQERVIHTLKEKKLPTVMEKRVYLKLRDMIDNGDENPDIKTAIDSLFNEMVEEQAAILTALPQEEIQEKFKPFTDKIRKQKLAEVKSKGKFSTQTGRVSKKPSATSNYYKSLEERRKAEEEYLKNRIDFPFVREE